MKATNLNMLFQDQIANFAHLITLKKQTKEEFIQNIKKTYCKSNVKTALFIQATEKSEFETIRLDKSRSTVLFNQ